MTLVPTTPSSETMSPEQMRSGLESLPQELYNEIYDLTFTAEPGVRELGAVLCRSHGKRGGFSNFRACKAIPFLGHDSDTLLQVDRYSRAKFAASYYGGRHTMFLAQNLPAASLWLQSLSPNHRGLVKRLHVVWPSSFPTPNGLTYFKCNSGVAGPLTTRGNWQATVEWFARLEFDAGEEWVIDYAHIGRRMRCTGRYWI